MFHLRFSIYAFIYPVVFLPSVLWHCWLGDRKSIRPVNILVTRCWRDICLERGANDWLMVCL